MAQDWGSIDEPREGDARRGLRNEENRPQHIVLHSVRIMRIQVQWESRRVVVFLGLLAVLSEGLLGANSSYVSPIFLPHPMTMLLRSQAVHRELGLNAGQQAAIVEAVEEVELPLWRLRDLPSEERAAAAGPLLQSLRAELARILTVRQLERLDQLIRQAHGIRAVFEPPVAAALNLSDGQRNRLRTLLNTSIRPSDRVRAERSALAVLSDPQKRALAVLMGAPFDLSRVQRIACRAPELERVTTWINSPALTLNELGGKVVVVHFYTFGCINCIRNLPHYNDWHERFAGNDLVVVGIHRPETKGEHDLTRVREKAMEAGIAYPAAVDNESRNWDAWANRIWPSVYLIDRNGFVRYWWYGELNWQGTQGEKWMRDRIVELLAEPYTASGGSQADS